MSARAVTKCRIVVLAGLGLFQTALGLPILISLTPVRCASFERQSAAPPLVGAESRLAQAEKKRSGVESQAGDFVAVAKVAEEQLSAGTQSEPAKSSTLALYASQPRDSIIKQALIFSAGFSCSNLGAAKSLHQS